MSAQSKRSPGRTARTSKHWPDEATFLRERDVFVLRQLMLDFSLPHHAAQIGGLIALHVNFESGVAEVGYPALVAQTNLSEDTISRAVRAMDQAGHLAVEYGRGRSQTNKIAWVIKPDTRSGGFLGMAKELIVPSRGRVRNTASERGFPDQENPAGERGFTGENPATRREKPRKLAEKTQLVCGTNTQTNTQLNTQGAEARSRAAQAPPQDEGGSSVEDDFQLLEDDVDGRAQRAPITVSEADHPAEQTVVPAPAAEKEPASLTSGNAATGYVSTVTEADLDAREAEELEAEIARDPFFAEDDNPLPAGWDAKPAIHALRDLWGQALPEPDAYVEDLIAAFVANDPVAQEFAVGTTMAIYVNAPMQERFARWPAHLDAVKAIFAANGRGPNVAEKATAAFQAAMRTEKAQRAAARPATAETIEDQDEDQAEETAHA